MIIGIENTNDKMTNQHNQEFKLAGPAGRFLPTYRLMKDPYLTYSNWSKRYGKTFLVKALNGNVVATSNTENIRRILAAKHNEIAPFAVATAKPLIGEHSVLLIEGEAHKQARALLTPPFRGEALRNNVSKMQDIANRISAQWRPGDRVRMMDFSLEYSLDVIIQVVFGVQEQTTVQRFKSTIKSYIECFRPIFVFTKLFQSNWNPSWNRFLKQKQLFLQMLNEQIEMRRSNTDSRFDILSMLLAPQENDGQRLSDSELRDQLTTLLFAGHETTQIAIAWAMSWLHRSPDVERRLREELDSTYDLDVLLRSELLDGICNEALRLNPIVADFIRVVHKPIELVELTLPANSNLAILTCIVHDDEEIYSDAKLFDPDRWSRNSFKPYEFLAFGGGVRRCIGATMALMEMKIALITWLRRFHFELPPDAPSVEPVHRRNLTMAPVSGIELIVKSIRTAK